MYFTNICTVTALSLAVLAKAEKGAANVHGCVWHSTKPTDSYTVEWETETPDDKCMKLVGSKTSMQVTDKGLTCVNLGKVAVDSSGLCYFKENKWGLSYSTLEASYSGSMVSRWTTGPANSDITIKESSPGTSVCSREEHCTGSYTEWGNGKNADIFFVFEPKTMA